MYMKVYVYNLSVLTKIIGLEEHIYGVYTFFFVCASVCVCVIEFITFI